MLITRLLLLPVFILAGTIARSPVYAQQPSIGINFKVLYTEPSSGIGGAPGLVFEASRGLFYGYSESNYGSTVFSFDAGGQVKTVYQFGSGTMAYGLIRAENGLLYGHGLNTVGSDYFSMALNGSSLQTYQTGALGAVGSFAIPTPDGYLYDLMGTSPNLSLARIDLSGNISTVYRFNPAVGVPQDNLVTDGQGNFYGVSYPQPSDPQNIANVFRLSSTGTVTELATFNIRLFHGAGAPIVLATDGNLYVGLAGGGTYKRGSIMRVTPSGQMTTVIDFPKSGPAGPTYMIEASDGYIYGSTFESPTFLFRFNPASPKLESLGALTAAQAVGAYFIQGSDGKFYGSSPVGGTSGWGTLFSFDLGLTPPKPYLSLFSPTAGSPGKKILLWGRNLLGATSVTFNGTLATQVTGTTSYSVYVTVPAGATSGPISIATPNGSYTTTGSFTIQ